MHAEPLSRALHGVFDTDHDAVQAFSIIQSGQAWTVGSGQLTVSRGLDQDTLNLSGATLDEVLTDLGSLGWFAGELDPDAAGQPASGLLQGSSATHGDQLYRVDAAFEIDSSQIWDNNGTRIRVTGAPGTWDFQLAGNSVYGLYLAIEAAGFAVSAINTLIWDQPATRLAPDSSASGPGVDAWLPAFKLYTAPPAWEVEPDRLTISLGTHQIAFSLDQTIEGLYAAIEAAGFGVTDLNSDLADQSAEILIPSRSATQGARVSATISLLMLYLHALGAGLQTARDDKTAALTQMDPRATTGEWCDFWGGLFGVPRREGETDTAYAPRIFREVVRPRIDRRAIEQVLREDFDPGAKVFEPWTRIQHPSGYQRILSGSWLRDAFWTHGLIEIRDCPDTLETRALIERYRAAGVFARYRDTHELSLGETSTLIGGHLSLTRIAPANPCAQWIINGDTLQSGAAFGNEPWTWTGGGPDLQHWYPLGGYTIASLYQALEADGFQVSDLNAQVQALQATTLISGASGQWGSQVNAKRNAFTVAAGQTWSVNNGWLTLTKTGLGTTQLRLSGNSIYGLYLAAKTAGYTLSGINNQVWAQPATSLMEGSNAQNGTQVSAAVAAFDVSTDDQEWSRDVSGRFMARYRTRAHESVDGGEAPHKHCFIGFPPVSLIPGAVLHTQILLSPDSTPGALWLGWRIDETWHYAYWGADSLGWFMPEYDEDRAHYLGDLPEAGHWSALDVPLATLIPGGAGACDGVVFAAEGGQVSFGKSGIFRQVAQGAKTLIPASFSSGASFYLADGAIVTDLYELAGTYVNVVGFSLAWGSTLYRLLDTGATGHTDHAIKAGEGWRLGDLISNGYQAGDTYTRLSQATWTTGNSTLLTQLTQHA